MARAGRDKARDVIAERGRAAPMPAHRLAVDKDLALIVHRAKVQDDALAGPVGGDVQAAVVPHHLDKVGVLDAREGAFGAKGHSDRVVKALAGLKAALHARLAKVKGIGPRAVQVDPVFAHELRARVFGAGQRCGGHCVSPVMECSVWRKSAPFVPSGASLSMIHQVSFSVTWAQGSKGLAVPKVRTASPPRLNLGVRSQRQSLRLLRQWRLHPAA